MNLSFSLLLLLLILWRAIYWQNRGLVDIRWYACTILVVRQKHILLSLKLFNQFLDVWKICRWFPSSLIFAIAFPFNKIESFSSLFLPIKNLFHNIVIFFVRLDLVFLTNMRLLYSTSSITLIAKYIVQIIIVVNVA